MRQILVENKWMKYTQNLVAMETSNIFSSWLDIEVTDFFSFSAKEFILIFFF